MMSSVDSGSGEDDDFWNAPGDGDAISLWMIFGVSIVVALGIAIIYQCRKAPAEDLTEGLVAVQIQRNNDDDDGRDEDEAVFGTGLRLDSRV